jgi:hypothetical protein
MVSRAVDWTTGALPFYRIASEVGILLRDYERNDRGVFGSEVARLSLEAKRYAFARRAVTAWSIRPALAAD